MKQTLILCAITLALVGCASGIDQKEYNQLVTEAENAIKLANQTGFTRGYLSRIEKSEKSPPLSTLGIIARILGITISFLVGEGEQQTPFGIVRKGERPLIVRGNALLCPSHMAEERGKAWRRTTAGAPSGPAASTCRSAPLTSTGQSLPRRERHARMRSG